MAQNAETSSGVLKNGEHIEKETFVEPIWHQSFFSELKGYLARLFSKRLSVSLVFPFII